MTLFKNTQFLVFYAHLKELVSNSLNGITNLIIVIGGIPGSVPFFMPERWRQI